MQLIQQLFQPQDVFVNWCCTLPLQLFYSYLLQRLCAPRSKLVYWGAIIVLTVGYTIVRPVAPQGFRLASGLFVAIAVPLLLLGGRPAQRLLVVGCMYLALMGAELVVSLIWISVTGLPTLDNAAAFTHGPLFAFMTLVDCGIQAIAAVPLGRFVERIFPSAGPPARIGSSASSLLFFLALFPVVQGMFLLLLMYIATIYANGSLFHMAVCGVLTVIMALMDMLLFQQIWKYREAFLAEQGARLLEQQIEGYLVEAEAVQDQLSALARFRHDLRNNVAVVNRLCEAGRLDEAGEYLQELKRGAAEL